jgi:hypothetical protein
MFLDNYVAAKARRQELIQQICDASDEMAEIDRKIPVLYSQALEDDLLRAEENALKESV